MEIESSDLVLDRAYAWERQMPNRIYMTQPMGLGVLREYTWQATLDEARRVAAHLQSYGFPPGSKIAIISKNCAHFIMSDLAIWMAGHVSVALYPTLQADTVRYILEHSEAKLAFIGKLDDWESMKAGVPAGMPCISYPLSPPNDFPTWDRLVKDTQPIAGSPTRGADETALLVYTSGSTGKPKGVEHTFRAMSTAGKGVTQALHMNSSERMLSYLPLAHVLERYAVEAASLRIGSQLFFAEALDTFVQDVQRCQPTIFHSVPRLWLKFQQGVLAKMPAEKLNRLLRLPIIGSLVRKKVLKGLGLHKARLAVSGSAPIPPELINWYRALGLELLEGYGMSENFAYSHVSLPGRSRVGYVGNCLPDVEHRISPEGEIQIKSPANMRGYFKEPELTRQSFTDDGFLKTGDRGEIDSEGRLKITGRVKELFKTSKGKYVAPAPIENLLNADQRIEMSCVAGAGQPQPFAMVMLSEQLRKQLKQGGADRAGIEQAMQNLVNTVNNQIEEYEQLKFVVIVEQEWQIENGFLTPTLKLKRNVVEDAYGKHVPNWYGTNKPVLWQS
ncbi:MAG: AMP-binding protein [Myxococcales bacterium]